MTRRIWVVLAAMYFTFIGWQAARVTQAEVVPHRTVYVHDSGSPSMPQSIVLRHCLNAEDTMGKLILVDYSPERAVYRCRKPAAY